MAWELTGQPCQKCSSSDAAALDDSGWWHCFSCKQSWTDKPMNGAMPLAWGYHEDPARKVGQLVHQMYGVETGLDSNFNPVEKRYPYFSRNQLIGHKHRKLPKDFYVQGKVIGEPFGWQQALQAGAKYLIIVEGEEDVLAVAEAVLSYQAGGRYAGNAPAVITGPTGVDSLLKLPEYVNPTRTHWQGVIMCLDEDEAAAPIRDQLGGMFDLPVYEVRLDPALKDPSKYIQEGRGNELAKMLLFGATPWSPVGLSIGKEIRKRELPKPIKEFVIPELGAKLGPYREGMVIGLGAGPGAGKGTFIANEVAGWLTAGHYAATFMLEDAEFELASKIAGVLLGHDLMGESILTNEQSQAIDWVLERTARLTNGLSLRFEELLSHVKFLHYRHGFKLFIIDPLTVLFEGSASQINEHLNASLNALTMFAQQTGSVILYTSHLNPVRIGPPHDEGGEIRLDQFTGSRAMIRYSHVILGLERNLYAPTDFDRNVVTFRIMKNRWGKKLGFITQLYNSDTGRFEPIPSQVSPPPADIGTPTQETGQ